MKRYLRSLMLLLAATWAVLPLFAAHDDARALISGLLNAGAEMVDSTAEKGGAYLNELKESYKAEGKEYAKELGDTVVQRIVQDKKINAALTSVQHLCYAVIAYLTAVTVLIIFLFCRIRSMLLQMRKEQR